MPSSPLALRPRPTKTQSAPPLPQSGQPYPGRPTRLRVDDASAVLERLSRVLATEGWQVIGAASGEEALDRMTQFQPALLITDLCMADVSGWDLLFHENLHRPNLPIFVITALPPSIVGGADHFAAEFFQKPLDLDALIAAIRDRLGTSSPTSPPPNGRGAPRGIFPR